MNAAMLNNNIRIFTGNANPELAAKICQQLSLSLGEALPRPKTGAPWWRPPACPPARTRSVPPW